MFEVRPANRPVQSNTESSNAMQRVLPLALTVPIIVAFVACGSDEKSGPAPATGGFGGMTTGGAVGSGGVGGIPPATGGAATGGTGAGGGPQPTGGLPGTGGTLASGGITGTGGAPATGGAGSGGAPASGGALATGGASSGGAPASGGASSGGASASGGAQATGGASGDANYNACVEQSMARGQSAACAACLCPADRCQTQLKACRDDVGSAANSGCAAVAQCANTPGTCCSDSLGCATACAQPLTAACGTDNILAWLSCPSSTKAVTVRDCRDQHCASVCTCTNP